MTDETWEEKLAMALRAVLDVHMTTATKEYTHNHARKVLAEWDWSRYKSIDA